MVGLRILLPNLHGPCDDVYPEVGVGDDAVIDAVLDDVRHPQHPDISDGLAVAHVSADAIVYVTHAEAVPVCVIGQLHAPANAPAIPDEPFSPAFVAEHGGAVAAVGVEGEVQNSEEVVVEIHVIHAVRPYVWGLYRQGRGCAHPSPSDKHNNTPLCSWKGEKPSGGTSSCHLGPP